MSSVADGKNNEICVMCGGTVRVRVDMYKEAYVKAVNKTFTVWFHKACYNENIEPEIDKALMEVVNEYLGSSKV